MIFDAAKEVCEKFYAKHHVPIEMCLSLGDTNGSLVIVFNHQGKIKEIREEAYFLFEDTPVCKIHEPDALNELCDAAVDDDGYSACDSDYWYVLFPDQNGNLGLSVDDFNGCQDVINNWSKEK